MLDWMILGDVLRTSLRLMVPFAFAALGGVICERSGVYNVGMEGMMLSGAFGAAWARFLQAAQSPAYGGHSSGRFRGRHTGSSVDPP